MGFSKQTITKRRKPPPAPGCASLCSQNALRISGRNLAGFDNLRWSAMPNAPYSICESHLGRREEYGVRVGYDAIRRMRSGNACLHFHVSRKFIVPCYHMQKHMYFIHLQNVSVKYLTVHLSFSNYPIFSSTFDLQLQEQLSAQWYSVLCHLAHREAV